MTFCGLQPTAGLVFSKAPLKICSAATDTYHGHYRSLSVIPSFIGKKWN